MFLERMCDYCLSFMSSSDYFIYVVTFVGGSVVLSPLYYDACGSDL